MTDESTMADMDFPYDAAAYVMYEAQTGSNVGSAQSWPELRDLLNEIVHDSREQLPFVAVVALDDKGQRIGSWPAVSVLEDA